MLSEALLYPLFLPDIIAIISLLTLFTHFEFQLLYNFIPNSTPSCFSLSSQLHGAESFLRS
jgi:ABC-type spermidine/putrescine transport system permease subunit II